MSNTAIQHYIDQLQQYADGEVWVEETFGKKLRNLDESLVFTRPLPQMHSVAEVISHLLEWRIAILSDLRGERRTPAEENIRNWRTNDELAEIGWQSLMAAFNRSRQELIELLRTKDDSWLDQVVAGETRPRRYYVDGLLQHDIYHLGQLGLIIKMLGTL